MHTRTVEIVSEDIPKSVDYETFFRPQLRALDESEGIIEGVAVPFGTWQPVNGYLEQMTPDTFRRSVESGSGQKAPLLTQHDYQQWPIGRAVGWQITDNALVGTWQIDMKQERAVEVYRLAAEGFLTGLSVGFVPDGGDKVVDSENGIPRVVRGPAQLREVSVCSVGAYPEAQILMNRSPGLTRQVDPRIAALKQKFLRG